MSVKLGSGNATFRLGDTTPKKIAIGAVEVWTAFTPTSLWKAEALSPVYHWSL
jgi:hypothetical protein